ncbi:NUDIX domain-containing protein [Leptolyngbya sp. CCY15150]|uniref:NUDIX hydrolase n=1 Tax=Leptolyngbya sp. CCY15150 TaxID=2767772 RepID=UPI001951458F|nr:NUDIX domain-containing protein [Leptolyngbya sp. CCY15150]
MEATESSTPSLLIRYCPACGQPTFASNSPKSYHCSSCEFVLFLNPSAAVAVIVECDRHLLMAVRGAAPGQGMLDLPGGFVDPQETAEQALARELQEELGLTGVQPQYFASFPNIYPYRGIVYQTTDLIYTLALSDRPYLEAADDVAQVVWIHRDELVMDKIAFSSIRQAVGAYLNQVCPV